MVRETVRFRYYHPLCWHTNFSPESHLPLTRAVREGEVAGTTVDRAAGAERCKDCFKEEKRQIKFLEEVESKARSRKNAPSSVIELVGIKIDTELEKTWRDDAKEASDKPDHNWPLWKYKKSVSLWTGFLEAFCEEYQNLIDQMVSGTFLEDWPDFYTDTMFPETVFYCFEREYDDGGIDHWLLANTHSQMRDANKTLLKEVFINACAWRRGMQARKTEGLSETTADSRFKMHIQSEVHKLVSDMKKKAELAS